MNIQYVFKLNILLFLFTLPRVDDVSSPSSSTISSPCNFFFFFLISGFWKELCPESSVSFFTALSVPSPLLVLLEGQCHEVLRTGFCHHPSKSYVFIKYIEPSLKVCSYSKSWWHEEVYNYKLQLQITSLQEYGNLVTLAPFM